jgi:hypothetical protein
METRRRAGYALVVIAALALAWTIGHNFTPYSAKAQTAPGEECCESIRNFNASDRTIAGPGLFEGPCDGIPRILVDAGRKRNLCVTVENLGECDVLVTLFDGNRQSRGSMPVPPGQTRAICRSSSQVLEAFCASSPLDLSCRFRWRVDSD